MKLEDIRTGVEVFSRDGHKLGSLSRVVLQKQGLRITHVVVHTGILRSGKPLWEGGFGLPYDKIVPLGVLGEATPEHVQLTMTADEFRDLAVDYDVEMFSQMPDAEPGRFDASDVERLVSSIPGEPGAIVVTDAVALAPDEVDIRKDSSVWRLSPHEKIGEVEHVIFDEDTGRIQSLVVRRGWLFTHEVVLPVSYVTEVVEALGGIVRVALSDEQLRGLADYTRG